MGTYSMKCLVACTRCKGSDELVISEANQVFYTKHTPIIAARLRPDDKWGFECACGNDSRISVLEKDQVDILLKGSSEGIVERIKKTIKQGNENNFSMKEI